MSNNQQTNSSYGRSQKQERLRELLNDPKLGKAERGWIRQEINRIKNGNKPEGIRLPPGMQLAHWHGFEAKKGFSYLFSSLQNTSLHKIQHRVDKQGKRSAQTPLSVQNFIFSDSGVKNSAEDQRQIREFYMQWRNGNEIPSSFRTEQTKQSVQFQNNRGITYNQYASYVKPGGIEIYHPLKPASDNFRNADIIINSVCVGPGLKSILVHTSKGPFRYIPADLSKEELLCLETAVKKTTKNGVMFSLERGDRVIDGVDFTMEGAEKILTTLTEADYLLCDLSYGICYSNSSKTVSVSTYENPIDVRCKLLNAAGRKDNLQNQRAYSIYSKFKHVEPYPTFQMNSSVIAIFNSNDGKISVQEPLFQIGMRGIYIDWLGNVYYDDKAECCLEQEPFLQDFAKNYTDYIRHYPVLARLEQYAIVIGLLLLNPNDSSINRIETFRRFQPSKSSFSGTGEKVIEAAQEANFALEALIECEPNEIVRLYMALHIANSWFGLEDFQRAKDGALLVLLYAQNWSDDVPDALIKKLCSEALLLLSGVLKNAVDSDKPNAALKLSIDEKLELEQLLLPPSQKTSDSIESTKIQKCINQAIDASLQLAINAEDWESAYKVARFAAGNWLEKNDSPAEETIVAEAWNVWKKSTVSQLKESFNAKRKFNFSFFIESLFPTSLGTAEKSSSVIEYADASTLKKFFRWLVNEGFSGSEALTQLNGFVFFVYAGMKLETNENNDKQQYHSALASCLCALRCFHAFFGLKTVVGINWEQLAAASMLRLASVCQRLFLEADNEEIKQGIEEAVKELEDLKQGVSSAKASKVLQPIHKVRDMAKRCRDGDLLVGADNLIIETYSVLGDMEKVALWQRTLQTDSSEYSPMKKPEAIFKIIPEDENLKV